MRKVLLLFILSIGFALPAFAQESVTRVLPADIQYAKTGDAQMPPYVAFKKGFFHRTRVFHLAPGAVIFDTNNRSIPLTALPEHVRVGYILNMDGDVQRIYVLTTNEIAQIP